MRNIYATIINQTDRGFPGYPSTSRVYRLRRLYRAVLQNDLELTRKLEHRQRSLIDLRDSYHGATPLMLATLIGSAKLVTLLLEKGALWDIPDRHGAVALKYSQGRYTDNMRNRYRRLTRSDAGKSLQQRAEIYKHLKGESSLHTQYRTQPVANLSFQRYGTTLKISKLITKVEMVRRIGRTQTCACIAPGNAARPEMCAVSGWVAINSPGLVNGEKYTRMVRDMAKILQVDLPAHCYDSPRYDPARGPRNRGRFYAVSGPISPSPLLLVQIQDYTQAHCEELLSAYWVERQLLYTKLGSSSDLS